MVGMGWLRWGGGWDWDGMWWRLDGLRVRAGMGAKGIMKFSYWEKLLARTRNEKMLHNDAFTTKNIHPNILIMIVIEYSSLSCTGQLVVSYMILVLAGYYFSTLAFTKCGQHNYILASPLTG